MSSVSATSASSAYNTQMYNEEMQSLQKNDIYSQTLNVCKQEQQQEDQATDGYESNGFPS